MKHRSPLALLVALLLGVGPSPALALTLSDLPSDASLSGPIQTLVDRGIISGYGDGTYRPRSTVSWREWAKLVLLARDSARGTAMSSADATLSDPVNRAVQEGLLPSWQPLDAPVPRVEGLRFLASAFGLTPPAGFTGTSPFVDAPEGSGSVLAYLVTLGVIRGVDPTHLGTTPLLRQEAAKVLWVAMQTSNPTLSQQPSVQRSSLRLITITRTTLSPGDDTAVIFAVDDPGGDTITGLTAGDFRMVVLQGSLTVTGFSEIGGGVYEYSLRADPQGPPGPIRLRIIAVTTVTNQFLDIGGESTSSSLIGLSVSPQSVGQGQHASIIAVPRDPNGRAVSGLTLSAQVVYGSGQITQQMAENPAGSGVYAGEFTATGIGQATIRVTITSQVTSPYAEVTIQQW